MDVTGAHVRTSCSHVVVKAKSLEAQAALSAPAQQAQDTLEISKQGKVISQGFIGKLNVLEHSASVPKPMFLKGVLQKMTGAKIGEMDIESLQLTRSTSSLDSTEVSAELQPGSASLTYENLRAQSSQVHLSVDGSVESKEGTQMDFTMQINLGKLMASYSGYSWSASQSTPAGPNTAE